MKSYPRPHMYTSNNRKKSITSFTRFLVLVFFMVACINSLFAQNKFPATGAVGIGTTTPNASSLLDVVSTSKGILIPRMTSSQRNNILSPATGLLVYVTDRAGGFYYYNGTTWVAIAGTNSAGANTSLSNLIPTAINQSLVPSANNAIGLGSSSIRWSNLYSQNGDFAGDVNIAGDVYKGLVRTISFKDDNTGLGLEAFHYMTGSSNTAVGYTALHNNTSGYRNTATGTGALAFTKTGFDNTANGANALYNDTSGTGNTATGSNALFKNSNGVNNTATGASAMYVNTTGSENTAAGVLALANNTTGNANVAVGSNALFANNISSNTVAIGDYALELLNGGIQNVAVGSKAGNQTKGSKNSYLGFRAGSFDNATDNTSVGSYAGWTVANGNECTFVGSQAGATVAGLVNTTGIGYNATPTASNQVRIGNTTVTSIGGQVSWSSLSDGRFKKNIKDNVPGLAFINLLKPVTYTFDFASLKKFKGEDVKEGGVKANADASVADKIIHTGFVAQEVEAVAKKMNYDFDGVDAPKNDKDAYGIRYAEFVVPLVKAVQELSKKNDELEERISKLEAAMSSKTANASVAQTTLKSITNSAAFLEQNTPNPSGNTTSIRYTLPQQYSSAQILITDNAGRMIQIISLASSKGSAQVDVSKLSAGSYRYSLLVDNTMVASKQMIVAK